MVYLNEIIHQNDAEAFYNCHSRLFRIHSRRIPDY